VLLAGAVYAGAGHLNIIIVILIAVAAAVAGDSIGYAIGHFGGRRLVLRFAPVPLRLVEGLRQAIGIIAGISGMPWRRFLAFNTLGAVLWVGVWAGLGFSPATTLSPSTNTSTPTSSTLSSPSGSHWPR
jgi:membrane protein DedA with SNARE-associated domain